MLLAGLVVLGFAYALVAAPQVTPTISSSAASSAGGAVPTGGAGAAAADEPTGEDEASEEEREDETVLARSDRKKGTRPSGASARGSGRRKAPASAWSLDEGSGSGSGSSSGSAASNASSSKATRSKGRTEPTRSKGRPAGAGRPCARVGAAVGSEAVTCSTRTARLTIATGAVPVLLADVQARLLRARLTRQRSGALLTVRLRLRNGTGGARRFNVDRRQLYLVVGPRQIRTARLKHRQPGTLDGTGRAVQPGRGLTGTVYFRLTAQDLTRLRRAKGRADLGIVPFAQLSRARPDRIGVIQLDLGDGAAS
jgi:hypothetical protein